MGLRILYDADADMATLYCSTSGWAFGPIFYAGQDYTPANDRAKAFIDWLPLDARQYEPGDLERLYGEWLMEEAAAGDGTDDDA